MTVQGAANLITHKNKSQEEPHPKCAVRLQCLKQLLELAYDRYSHHACMSERATCSKVGPGAGL